MYRAIMIILTFIIIYSHLYTYTYYTYTHVSIYRIEGSELCPFDAIFQQEVKWLKSKQLKQLEDSDYKLAQQLNDTIAEEEGSKIECQCCYCEYTIDNIIQCSNGHLFCKVCIQRYIEETVFGQGRSMITCLCSDTSNNEDTTADNSTSTSNGGSGSDSSSGNVKSGMCKGYFTDTMVKMCLPEAVYIKYTGKRVDLGRIIYASEGYI